MTMTSKRTAGLTLMELLIVLAIIAGLAVIMLPIINIQRNQWLSRQANLQINTLRGQLEQYNQDNRGYPTTEQGLYALIFIPDNVGLSTATLQPPGNMTGAPGMMGETDMEGGMFGGSGGAGPELLNQPNPMNTMNGMMGNTQGMMGETGMMSGGGGTMASAWTQPTHNSQIYTQQRRRPNPYILEKDLTDSWGRPFRYDNSRSFYGLNRTGSEMPAIWSAGRDGQDGTDDDILGWDPEDAAQALAIHQQQMQMRQMNQGGMGGQQGFDPMNPMSNQMMQQGMPPMGTGQPPMGTGMPPMGTGQPPMGTGMPPMGTGQPPMGTGMPPMGTGQPPMGTGMPPMGTGQPPMGTGMPPMGTGM